MEAFKEALENEYGALGTHAFDTIVGSRAQLKKSLRACDVKAVISSLPQIREKRLIGETWARLSNGHCLFAMTDGMNLDECLAKLGL